MQEKKQKTKKTLCFSTRSAALSTNAHGHTRTAGTQLAAELKGMWAPVHRAARLHRR